MHMVSLGVDIDFCVNFFYPYFSRVEASTRKTIELESTNPPPDRKGGQLIDDNNSAVFPLDTMKRGLYSDQKTSPKLLTTEGESTSTERFTYPENM